MSSFHVLSPPIASSRAGQLLRSCLLALGAGLLLFWLAGGFPPTAWLLLLQACAHIDILWSRQGTSLFLPLGLLIGQSLAQAAAWGLLLLVIVREYAYLKVLWSEQSLSTKEYPRMFTDEQRASQGYSLENAVDQAEQHAQQAYEESQRAAVQTYPEQKSDQNIKSFFKTIAQNPFEEASPVIKEQLFNAFQAGYGKKDQKSNKSENMFIFGNPFEGPLPDVFTYDRELKNMLVEIEHEVMHAGQKYPRISTDEQHASQEYSLSPTSSNRSKVSAKKQE